MRTIKNILTVTLNPAYDIHYYIPHFAIEKECYIESTIMSAGGKGINISRALTINGIKNTAFMMAGCENPSQIDQIHMDAQDHYALAEGICSKIHEIIG